MNQLTFQLKPKKSAKYEILSYLQRKHYMWVNGGELERKIADITGQKPATISRTLRKMAEEKEIQKRIPTKSVEYKYIEV